MPSAVRLGLIADVQYADADDGLAWNHVERHYRGALAQLRRAVDWWNARDELALVANLGDSIDSLCKARGQSEAAMRAVMSEFARLEAPVRALHCVGNHELVNFPDRTQLRARLRSDATAPSLEPAAEELTSYYAVAVPAPSASAPAVRVLVLDPYQLTMLTPADGEEREAARAILRAHNPNDMDRGDGWFEGVASDKRHFIPVNGALGGEQLAWLRAQLAEALTADERVLVLSHIPLHPAASDGAGLPWDYEEALLALRACPAVVAVLAGHCHEGGYACDDLGVHHLTLKSPLNLGERGSAFGLLEVGEDELRVEGPSLADLLDPKALVGAAAAGQDPAGTRLRLPTRAGRSATASA
jgi:manganese-dependent ADP-ribose/CDP-alcohol diphosphatase